MYLMYTRTTIYYVATVFTYIGIPAVENLMAVDNCTNVTVSWNITDEVAIL